MKSAALGFLAPFLLASSQAFATPCTSFPYPLTNGATADAEQVMSNYTYLSGCLAPIASPSFTGNVGIGTMTAGVPLDVASALTGGNAPYVAIENTSGATPGVFGPSVIFNNHVSSVNPFILGQKQSTSSEFYIADANSPYTEYFAVSQGGNVGIGTANPQNNLHLDGNNVNQIGATIENDNASYVTYAPSAYLALVQAGSSGYGIGWANAGVIEGTGTGGLIIDAFGPNGGPIQFQTNRITKMAIANGGNVGIGTTSPSYLLQVSSSASGAVAAWQNSTATCSVTPGSSAPTFTCSSDERLKKDIVDAGAALPALTDVRVRDFTVRATGERMTGIIAQEMLKTHPDMVHKGPDGFYKVDQPNPWKLVKAIQELKTDNEHLSEELADRTARIAHQENELEKLRQLDSALEQSVYALGRRIAANDGAERESAALRIQVDQLAHRLDRLETKGRRRIVSAAFRQYSDREGVAK